MARSPELARLFQDPDSPAQRRYEICRAYFHEHTPADELARRFHLHVDSVRAIVRDFARDPDLDSLRKDREFIALLLDLKAQADRLRSAIDRSG